MEKFHLKIEKDDACHTENRTEDCFTFVDVNNIKTELDVAIDLQVKKETDNIITDLLKHEPLQDRTKYEMCTENGDRKSENKSSGAVTFCQTLEVKTETCVLDKESMKGGNSVCEDPCENDIFFTANPFKCTLCDQNFNRCTCLNKHLLTNTEAKPHYYHKYDMNAEKSSTRIHNPEKPYNCEICNKRFKREGTLSKHFQTHAKKKIRYKCEVCDKSFNRNSHLIDHARIHTGEKPFTCLICEKKFVKGDHLTRHLRIHTGEKPYECKVCLKKFAENGSLLYHVRRNHTGETPYDCEYCEKKFSVRFHLTQHMRTHTGEKPYMCLICDKGFSVSSTLIRHLRTHKNINT